MRDAVADMEELWRKRYQVAQDRGSTWKSRADYLKARLRARRVEGEDSGDEDSEDFSDSDDSGDEPADKRKRHRKFGLKVNSASMFYDAAKVCGGKELPTVPDPPWVACVVRWSCSCGIAAYSALWGASDGDLLG
jgi:hypothetical protein